MGWVDTHCHLQLDERGPETLLARAGNVDWVVAPGVDLKSSAASLDLADRYPGRVLATAGLHPHDAADWARDRAELTELARVASAIGETGLDFYRNLAPREDQIASFEGQIALALELGKPIIVHCRDAFSDVFTILERTGAGPAAVLHCWTGGTRWTRRFLGLGVMFSFAGPIAFETGDTIRLGAALVPPDRALVETDTPFLAPPPHRGEPNEPGWVPLVGAALAAVWSMDPEEVATITTANATRVFLPPQGGVPAEPGRGELLGPPQGGVPAEPGRGELLGPPQGGVPAGPGRGELWGPPQGGVPAGPGRRELLGPPQGGVPAEPGRRELLGPPQGGVPAEPGRGETEA